MNRSDLSFLETMFQCKVSEIKYRLIIVNQSKTTTLRSDYPNIQVFNESNFGLSRSRNMAISKSDASYAWILDDDVQILPGAIDTIIDSINIYEGADLLFFKIRTPEGFDKRIYLNEEKSITSRSELNHIHSVEMVLHVNFLRKHNLNFDLRFGLGAQFEMGEEFLLAQEIFETSKQIVFIPKVVVLHDEMSTGNDPANNRVIYARGALAAKENLWTAQMKQFKYVFFLWRKGYVKGWRNLYDKYMVFNHGMNDYLTGFEGHRIGHPDL
ncbi:hypothetical protein BST92_08590 [Nonlabens arenilitoris]|uniref:Glycosyltransferase 2-like domain-containing protein n=2 Tax=Nonlabens arenilitoris TaxID=1217969 RepID=A0A2S7UAN2_9FLAO|nr:hypothetical protein BST92_08590 [Nonlabens arenilitoris]